MDSGLAFAGSSDALEHLRRTSEVERYVATTFGRDPRGAELMETLRRGDLGRLATLLSGPEDERRALLAFRDRSGQTPLMRAAAHLAAATRLLLERGAPVDELSTRTLNSALMFATEPEVAALLLARGASVSLRNAAGVTPLLFAAKYETPPLLGTLLAHAQPADLEASRAPGETPLLVALLKGDRAAVALLLRAGADVFNAAGGSLRPDQVGGACADLVAHRSSRVQLGTALQGAVQAHGNRERKLSVNFSQSHLYDRRIWRLVGRFVLE